MDLIVNVCKNMAIGLDGGLAVAIPEDLKRFRELTLGKTVIYGSKTLGSFPGGRPLQKRRNIILSRRMPSAPDGAELARSLDGLRVLLRDTPEDEQIVIGGEMVYRLLLPFCRRAFVTKNSASPRADSFFPDLDSDPSWQLESSSDMYEYEDIKYQYLLYVNKKPLDLAEAEHEGAF